jgi:transcriptional regulator with XRE-family HTH domain
MQQIFAGPTGAQLREERIAAGLKGFEVAIAMRVHSSRVSQIEALAQVPADSAERYRVALIEALATKEGAA